MKTGFTQIDIDRLVKADWNYKDDDQTRLEKLVANLKRNGQVENIIVRELETGFFEVVNGNHRYDAMVSLGVNRVWCFNLGRVSLAAAQRIAVETNETKFDSNQLRLAEVIREIQQEFPLEELVSTLPFSEQDIEAMNRLHEFPWDAPSTTTADGSGEGDGGESGKNMIRVFVDDDVFESWKTLNARLSDVLGYDNPNRVFEFAVIEALNLPVESLR